MSRSHPAAPGEGEAAAVKEEAECHGGSYEAATAQVWLCVCLFVRLCVCVCVCARARTQSDTHTCSFREVHTPKHHITCQRQTRVPPHGLTTRLTYPSPHAAAHAAPVTVYPIEASSPSNNLQTRGAGECGQG